MNAQVPLKKLYNDSFVLKQDKQRPMTANRLHQSIGTLNSAERNKVNPYASIVKDQNQSLPQIRRESSEVLLRQKRKSQPTTLFGGHQKENYMSTGQFDVANSIESVKLLAKHTHAQSQNDLKPRPQSSSNLRYQSHERFIRKQNQTQSNIHIVDHTEQFNKQNSQLTLATYSTDAKVPIRKKSQERSFQDISPELAAQIVRHHILPMFEAKPGHKNTGSVYKELKLSDQLNQELQLVREQVWQLQESLQEKSFQNATFSKQQQQLKTKLLHEQATVKSLKVEMALQKCKLANFEQRSQELEIQTDQIRQFLESQQQQFHNASLKLKQQLYQCDKLQGQFDHMHHNQTLKSIQNEVMQEQISKLFKQLGSLPGAREVQERFEFYLRAAGDKFESLKGEYESLLRTIQELNQEKDSLIQLNKEIKDQKLKQDQQRMLMLVTCKDQVKQMEEKVKERNEEALLMRETLNKLEVDNKILERERIKLRQRNNKLKQRKGVDKNFLLCKNCGKDYQDSENFNWSCRTHQSEFSGEMWWCCGKTSKDAVGCKFRKHEQRNEEQEDEELDGQNMGIKKLARCQCCKQIGHVTLKCPNDPNFKTITNLLDMGDAYNTEEERIANSALQKKKFAQTIVQTTHFLKKCVIQPMKDIVEGEEQELPTQKQSESAFKRGVMGFEDYNYAQFNPYILVSDKKTAYKVAKEDESHGTRGKIEVLTENKLNSIRENYDHESLKSKPEDPPVELQIEAKVQPDHATVDDDNQSQGSKGKQAGEDIEDEEDENTLVVYFAKQQIDKIKNKQERDQFLDLLEMKSEMKNLEIAQGSFETAIQIMEFAPKEEVKVDLDKKKKVVRRKLTAKDDPFDDEQFQQEMREYNNRDPNAGKSQEQIEWEKEQETLKQLRKIEEKMIYTEINQLITEKKKKIDNEQTDREIAKERQSLQTQKEPKLNKYQA